MNRLPDELQARLDAGIEALVRDTLGAHYGPLIDSKRQEVESKQRELEALELEYAQAVKGYFQRSRGETPLNGSRGKPAPERSAVGHTEENHPAQNGSAGRPTRRQMLHSVLPELRGGFFKRRDADKKVVERWPQAEPTTPAERKNFAAANAQFLNELAKEGRLEARKGEGRFDPAEYRVIDNNEDTLLEPEP